MKRALGASCLLLILLPAIGCRSSHGRPEGAQEKFGVRMAKMNLWREALFRFKRAVELNPGNATAHNNLAVAYEANGDSEAAAREYREAMRLDKSNQYIQKNYSRFVEFTSRNKKRQRPQAAPAKPGVTDTAAQGASAAVAAPPPTSTAPAPDPAKVEPPPTLGGIGGSGAPPATKPAAVPQPAPSTPPPATTPAPPAPPPPAPSGGAS